MRHREDDVMMRAIQQPFFPSGQPLLSGKGGAEGTVAVPAGIAANLSHVAARAAEDMSPHRRRTAVPHPLAGNPLIERKRMRVSETIEVPLKD
jgi:hypothetical protein